MVGIPSNPAQEAEAGESEFEASLAYKVRAPGQPGLQRALSQDREGTMTGEFVMVRSGRKAEVSFQSNKLSLYYGYGL